PLYPGDLESIPAHPQRAVRGPRSQPDPPRPRSRDPSADALSRLCRILDLVLVRDRRLDRRPHRRGLGALGTAVDAARLDVSDRRHRDGLVLGLLHAGLGRLVVLGPGRERLADALDRRHRAAALRGGDGEAQCAQGVDHPARDPGFLALADRHLPGALGVLTSVHAFASDPTRGVFILMILVMFIGGGLALFALRAPLLKQGGLFAPISREGALVLNNLFLVSACATVFVGTLYPLALEALTDEKISVGAPFFNATFAPLFVPLLIAMPFGPLLAWKRGDLLGVAQRLVGAAGIAVIAVAVIFAMEGGGPLLVPFAIGLAFYVMAGALTEIVERTGLLRVQFATAFARARGLPRSAWGATFA